jgi:hypothetical protein
MKYPLSLIERRPFDGGYAIRDDIGMIVCNVPDHGNALQFSEFIVRAANRWHRWRSFFRPNAREDWMWERNTWRP